MSARLTRLRAVFVEPPLSAHAGAAAVGLPPWAVTPAAARSAAPSAPGGRGHAPTIVVLCTATRSRVTAATFALALANVLGARAGIAAATGASETLSGAGVAMPSARRAAARLRTRGEAARASGRLVWLPDRRVVAAPRIVERDPAGAAAAASADLGRAVIATGLPGALAIPLARSAALDRVIAWHDGVVVLCEPDAEPALVDLVLASVSSLGRPTVCVSPPARRAAALAQAGLHAPVAAAQAVAELGLGAWGA